MTPKKDLIILGAGLSGLYTAFLLKDMFNIIILEARDRCGGRIMTKDGHDLGPSWIWPHQKSILSLVHGLGLELFAQYTKGNALYDAPQGVQSFNAPASAPSSRVRGGLDTLIRKLVTKLPSNSIRLEQEAIKILYHNPRLEVKTASERYEADYIISTISPRLAKTIVYSPALDDDANKILEQTPTWMGHSSKCVVEFTKSFWRDMGLSGFVFSPIGPLAEIHDASTADKPALFGFLHSHASIQDIEEEVRQQMKRLFGDNSELITNIYCIDWRQEKYSSSPLDHKGPSRHPEYGLDLSHFDGRLIFGGTETSHNNGGYLEGAVNSAIKISERLRSIVL